VSSTFDGHAARIESRELRTLNSELEEFAGFRRSPSIRTKRHPHDLAVPSGDAVTAGRAGTLAGSNVFARQARA